MNTPIFPSGCLIVGRHTREFKHGYLSQAQSGLPPLQSQAHLMQNDRGCCAESAIWFISLGTGSWDGALAGTATPNGDLLWASQVISHLEAPFSMLYNSFVWVHSFLHNWGLNECFYSARFLKMCSYLMCRVNCPKAKRHQLILKWFYSTLMKR